MSEQTPANGTQPAVPGTDPTKNEQGTKPGNVETPKDGEKPFDEKVFEDPRLWQHPRFKSLNDRAKKADELEKAQQAAEEKRLADAKKFEELAAKRAQERDEVKNKYTQSLQDNRIITEASKVGVVDIDTVLKLIDRSSIQIDDNGNVIGATEAVQALLASKPFLKGKGTTTTIGSGTSPSADDENGPKKFKLSQIQDATFYREHEKDILAAYKLNLIEDDLHK